MPEVGLLINRKNKWNLIERLRRGIFRKRLHHPLVAIFMVFAAVFLAYVTAKYGLTFSAMILGLLIALPTIYCIVIYPKFGMIVLLIAAYFIMYLIRALNVSFPLGTMIDGLEALLMLGLILKMKKKKEWMIFYNPISGMILLWVFFNLVEAINPWADSQLAWVYTVRTVAFVMLMYFVFMYHIRTVSFIRLVIYIWLALAFISALYAIKQEYFGFSTFEYADLASDPERGALYFIDGHWRKFSIFNDPVVFAYNMVLISLLCFTLMWGPTLKWQKIALGVLSVLFLNVMLYSGTRGAYVLVPAGMILFAILNFNKGVLAFMIVGTIGFIFLITVPSSDPSITRFQSAFKPGEDASYNVRQMNQAKIKPFIQSHPIGAGLGSVGVWGRRFSPNSPLSKFPPDSGYVRVAVEMGWLGLFIFCVLMFTILYQGIKSFFIIKNPELKTYCLAMTIMIFAINIGNYPQEALVQYPTSIYFYLMVAILNKCVQLDRQEQEDKKKLAA